MPKKKTTSSRSATHASSYSPLAIAAVFILLGLFGLALALQMKPDQQTAHDDDTELQVVDGEGNAPHNQQTPAGQNLQNAARTKDLIKGQEGDTVQPGTSIDQLTDGKQIN